MIFCHSFPFLFKFKSWPTLHHVFTLAWVHFCPETIYFISVQVQIIFYELDSNCLPTSKILLKISSLRVTGRPVTSKKVKIRLSRNSMKFIWVTRFRERNPTIRSVSSFEIYKIYRFSTCTISAIYYFANFQKKFNFHGFYNMDVCFCIIIIFVIIM